MREVYKDEYPDRGGCGVLVAALILLTAFLLIFV